MAHSTFGFLDFFGVPFNGKNRPSKFQVFLHVFLILGYLTNSLLYFSDEQVQKEIGWVNFAFMNCFFILEDTVSVFCLFMSIRKKHPLIEITNHLKAIIPYGQKTRIRWFIFGIFLMVCISLGQIHVKSSGAFYIQEKSMISNLFLVYLYLAQVIMPVSSMTQQMADLRERLRLFRTREDGGLSRDTWDLILQQKELEELYSDLIKGFYYHLMLIVYMSLCRSALAFHFCIAEIIKLTPEDMNRLTIEDLGIAIDFVVASEALYRIWCLAHPTELIKVQMEKFYSDLFTLCLEDKTRTLIQNDMINLYLERKELTNHTQRTFFPLGHSMFFSILSKVASCVFIILQFHIYEQYSN